MAVLENNNICVNTGRASLVEEPPIQIQDKWAAVDGIELNYFDLLDEVPEFSEAAILLEDGAIEYCYVKTGTDGKQYFGFDHCLPGTLKYKEVVSRHKLTNKMEANTFELYPSGKTVLSKRGRILEVNIARKGEINV